MATITILISDLPNTMSVGPNDLLILEQNGTTYACTVSQLFADLPVFTTYEALLTDDTLEPITTDNGNQILVAIQTYGVI